MNPLKLQIVIDAQNKSEAVMKQVSGQFSKLNKQIDDLQPAFGAMAAAGTAAFGAVAGAVGVSIGNYVEAERSVRQLEHAVIDVSKGNREQVDSILAITDALQKKAGIDGDALTMGVAQLSTFGLQTQSVLDLTKSLADLTVNQSGLTAGADDYVSSANVMAKALQGQFGVLEKSGIRFTEAQQNLILLGTESEKVAALTEGLNQNLRETTDTIGDTAEAGFAKLQQSLGDISEVIGETFLPVVEQVVTQLIPVVQKVGDWAAENPKLVTQILVGVAALGGLVAVIGTIGLAIPAIIAGFSALGTAIGLLGTVFSILLGPVGLVIAIIAALIAAGVLLYQHWDEVKAFAVKIWGEIADFFQQALNRMLETVNSVWKAIQDAFWTGVNFMIGAAKLILDWLAPGWEETLMAVWNITVAIFDGLTTFLSDKFNFILNNIVIPVLTAIKTFWDKIWGDARNSLGSAAEGIKSIITGAMDAVKAKIDTVKQPIEDIIALAQKAIDLAKKVGVGIGNSVSNFVSKAVETGSGITGRALGGPVGTSHPYNVGENGPEMFWPNSAGRIVPAGAGGASIVLNINGATFMGREGIAEQIGDEIVRILKNNVKL